MSDEELLNKLVHQLNDHEKRISALEGTTTKKAQTSKQLSLREFLLMKKPNDDVQRTLAIGYYLEQYKSMDSFNARDLTDGFRSAKEPPPGNINDKVNMNIRKGHMMDAKEPKDKFKAWMLTSSGEKFVDEGFAGD